MSEDNTNKPSKQFFRNVLQGTVGHMPGFFMARIIVSQGYKKKMITTSANPFAFYKLYQRAAKKDPAHPPLFSQTAMKYLSKLEHKYTSPDMIQGD